MSGATRTTGSHRRRAIVSSIGALAIALSTTIAMSGSAAAAAAYNATSDVNSMYNTTLYTGVQNWWKAGYTGDGVDVAVIDTGVTPVDGLADPGKVIYGPDLSLDAPADNLHNLDANGHGTFMAGIIAGRGSGADPGSYAGDQTNFLGVAPDARIVSVKVGASDGSVDVSQVIAAIDWVVQHRNDNGLNIRVLNLSYGTDSAQPYQVDPLAYAVEQAWKAGIFVVAATGNAGYQFKTGTLADPAYDPKIFAVGATEAQGTMSTSDDTVASFSSTGSNGRYVDVVNPGSHLVSLRVPGSYIDQTFGNSGYVSDGLFRGSGTSEAAAFTSGEAALAIQQRPDITPGQLKKLFLSNGRSLNSFSSLQQGQGEVDMAAMLRARTPVRSQAMEHDRLVHGDRIDRALSRHAAPGRRRRGADGRAGHLRPALRCEDHGGAGSGAGLLVGRRLERQHLVGQRLGQPHVEQPHLEQPHVVGCRLVQPHVERQHLVLEYVVGW